MDPIAALGAINGVKQTIDSMTGSASDKQQQYQLELMREQEAANRRGTDYQTQKAKEMYEYTGYGSKVRQMKDAGLNPALVYQQGGAGVTGNINAPQVSQGSAPNVAAEKQINMGMALQLAKLQSEIDVNKSVTERNIAEAGLAGQNKKGQEFDLGVKTETREETINQIKNLSQESGENLLSKQLANTLSTLTMDNKVNMTAAELANEFTNNKILRTEVDLKEAQLENVLTNTIKTALESNYIDKNYDLRVKELAQQLRLGLGAQGLTQEQIDQNKTRMWVDAVSKAIGIAVGARLATRGRGEETVIEKYGDDIKTITKKIK